MNRRKRIAVTTVAATGMLCAAGAAVAIAAPRSTPESTPVSTSATVDSEAQADLRSQLAALDVQSAALHRKVAAAAADLTNRRKAQLERRLAELRVQSVPTSQHNARGAGHSRDDSAVPAPHPSSSPTEPVEDETGDDHESEPTHD